MLRFAAACFAAMLVLDAPAMLRSADALPADSPSGVFARKVLPPFARVSEALRLSRLRAAAEAFERRWLEPAAPSLPLSSPSSETDEDDDSLDEFLDF